MTAAPPASSTAESRSAYERADAILGAFDADHLTLSLPALTARSGLPKTTTYRIIVKLIELGWLTRRDGRYELGIRLFELAGLSWLQTNLRSAALPSLEDLFERPGRRCTWPSSTATRCYTSTGSSATARRRR